MRKYINKQDLFKNKGFSLIELLAVIVILSIIAVITTPIILSILDEVNKGVFKNSAYGLIRTVQLNYAQDILNGKSEKITFTYINSEEISSVEGKKLDYKGERPKIGIIIVNEEGQVGLAIHNGKYCVEKKYNEDKVSLSEKENENCIFSEDNIPPTITFEPDGSISYIKSSNVKVIVIDQSIDETSLKYVWKENEEILNDEEYIINFENMGSIPMPIGSGSFYLHVIAKDTLDNIAREYRKFLLDNEMPIITINGEVNITINKGSTYIDAGATAIDNIDENVHIIVTGTVNPSMLGTYTITYTAEDDAGNIATATRTINVIDADAPVITINGDNPININVGEIYSDLGATAIDDVDGDITNNIEITGSVNPNIPGTYTVTYMVSDSAGNTAIKTRTINVIDNIPPTVVFGTNGNSIYAKSRSTTITVSDAHSSVNTSSLKYLWNTSTTAPSEASFTTSFTNGGIVTSQAGVTGTYYLWILAKDSIGNTIITRSNGFNLDNTIPVISSIDFNGYTPGTWATGTLTVTIAASDTNSGIQKYQYSVDSGSTWYDIPTSWSIWDGYNGITIFKVVDNAGNVSVNSSSYLLKRDASVPSVPTVNLNGYTSGAWTKGNITFSLNSTDTISGIYKYQYSWNSGSTWNDVTIGTNGWTYNWDADDPLIFRSVDGAGNISGVTNTYTFRRDATKPTITITGNNPVTVYVGDSYVDSGATATDNLSGLSGSVVATGTVNPSITGNYTITYTVSDKAGNTQTATRTVNVVQRPFTCGTDNITDARDGKSYRTVQIGTQCWMAENLKYTGSGCLSKNWTYGYPYAYDACRTHTNTWGTEVLYQWKAATNGSTTSGAQGLCPDGWHLPTQTEWSTLESYLGTNPGTKLKYVGYWSNGTESNTSGFSALPTGRRTKENSHTGVDVWTGFWSSTPCNCNLYNGAIYTEAYYRYLRSNYTEDYKFFELSGIGAEGYSIRCLKNQ